jgi:hypothetical protein
MPIHDWTRVNAGIFHDFHHEWISTLKRSLNAGLLPTDYYALAEQVAGGLWPDVLTLETARTPPPESNGGGTSTTTSAVAVATAPPRVRFTAVAEEEQQARKRSRVVIRHSSGDQVVAVIEVVSPGNKSNRHALRSFVDKAIELLDAGVHLLLLDLHPPGPRDPQGIHAAIWSEISDDKFELPEGQPLTLVAYAAAIPKHAYIEPVAVGQVLPEMPLFLEPDLYIPVPLETSYQSAFEAVPRRWQEVLGSPTT